MFKNGWEFDNEKKEAYQRESPGLENIYPIPEIFKFHFIKTEELGDFSQSYAFNCTTESVAVMADLEKIKKTNILIPMNSENNNFLHGAAPRFPQIWRNDDGES